MRGDVRVRKRHDSCERTRTRDDMSAAVTGFAAAVQAQSVAGSASSSGRASPGTSRLPRRHLWRKHPCGNDWDIVQEQTLYVEGIWGISQAGLEVANAVRAAKVPPEKTILRPEQVHQMEHVNKALPFSKSRPRAGSHLAPARHTDDVVSRGVSIASETKPDRDERDGKLYASRYSPWLTVALVERRAREAAARREQEGTRQQARNYESGSAHGSSPKMPASPSRTHPFLDRPTPALASRRWARSSTAGFSLA